jgi:hypothetical protein
MPTFGTHCLLHLLIIPRHLNFICGHFGTLCPIFYEDGTECSETSAYKIQTPGNYPEENIQDFIVVTVTVLSVHLYFVVLVVGILIIFFLIFVTVYKTAC